MSDIHVYYSDICSSPDFNMLVHKPSQHVSQIIYSIICCINFFRNLTFFYNYIFIQLVVHASLIKSPSSLCSNKLSSLIIISEWLMEDLRV